MWPLILKKTVQPKVTEKQENRSVFINPKQAKNLVVERSEKDGFITKHWQTKVSKFYQSLIPSHISNSNKIWLNNSEDLNTFIDDLRNPDSDLSKIEYVCITGTIADIYDVIEFFSLLRKKLPDHARVIYSNYNLKWEFIFKLSASIGFSKKGPWGNFYRDEDLDCFLDMSGWENIQKMRRYLIPFEFGIITKILDAFVRLPVIQHFALNTTFIARKSGESKKKEGYSVTVLVPCKNEEDNIEAILKRMPDFGKSIEFVFIDDKSTDKTTERILHFMDIYPDKIIKLIEGPGIGKSEALRTGMKKASGDICMILDADLSVIPEDLPQFYEALSLRRADFIHGTRMVYPQEREAMRFLNIIGNLFFSLLFSYILGQRITDTLCGTKVYWRRDWPIFEEMRIILKKTDVWGDYNLVFGAARFGLKIGELPVRYFQRLTGFTKMTKRIKNALIMLRVVWYALCKVRFLS